MNTKKISLLALLSFSMIVTASPRKTVIIGEGSDFTKNGVDITRTFWCNWDVNWPESMPVIKDTSTCRFDIMLDKPELMYMQVYSGYQYIYITPGDSVHFKVVNEENKIKKGFRFTGKNSAHYNYFIDLTLYQIKNPEPLFVKGSSIAEFKLAVEKWRDMTLDFLKNYKQGYAVSDSFEKTAIDFANAEFIQMMYAPLASRKISLNELPKDYFDQVSKINLNDDDKLHIYYNPLLMENITFFNKDPFTLEGIKLVYNNIIKNYSGKTKDFLITALIGNYAKNQEITYKSELVKIINDARENITEPVYLASINKSEENYSIVGNPLPNNVLEKTLLRPFGTDKTITLKELFDINNGKKIYIDFWASWCVPCRADIKNSSEANKILKDNGVKKIYISIDKNEADWIKATNEDSITDNQYLLIDGKKSPIYSYFKYTTIPQYVFLNSKHTLVRSNAPKPRAMYNKDLESLIKK